MRPVRRAEKLTTFTCRLSCNLGASTSWNLQGLSRPAMRLLYLYLYQSVLFFHLSFQIAILHLLIFVFWSSSKSTFVRIIVKYLNYFSFTIRSISTTNQIQPTSSANESKAIPLQVWTAHECSRRMRLPDCKTIGT